jgi:hypothetical protein
MVDHASVTVQQYAINGSCRAFARLNGLYRCATGSVSVLVALWATLDFSSPRTTRQLVYRSERTPETSAADAADDAVTAPLQQRQQNAVEDVHVKGSTADTGWQRGDDNLDDQSGMAATAGATALFNAKTPFKQVRHSARAFGITRKCCVLWQARSAQFANLAKAI